MSPDSGNAEFDWADADVVVEEQLPVACYTNPAGDVVLRQRAAWPDNDDLAIWFAPQHARAIAAAILRVAGYQAPAPAPEPAQASAKPKPATPAERQRRRRARQEEPTLDSDRDSVTPPVTSRDGAEG